MNRLENSTIELSEKPFNLIDLLMEITAMTNIQIDAQVCIRLWTGNRDISIIAI